MRAILLCCILAVSACTGQVVQPFPAVNQTDTQTPAASDDAIRPQQPNHIAWLRPTRPNNAGQDGAPIPPNANGQIQTVTVPAFPNGFIPGFSHGLNPGFIYFPGYVPPTNQDSNNVQPFFRFGHRYPNFPGFFGP